MSIKKMIDLVREMAGLAYDPESVIAALRAGQQMREHLKYYTGWSEIEHATNAWDAATEKEKE